MLGIFEEGTYGTSGGDLTQLKDYLIAKALWDPSVDADALVASFLAGYYGEAAAGIKAYMGAMLQGIEQSSYYMHESFDINAPFLTPQLLLTSAAAFVAAHAAVAGGDARFVHRVEEAGMPLMYVVLFRWGEVKAYAKQAGVAWPYNATLRPQFDEFKRRYQHLAMSKLDERGRNITWMEQALFPNATAGAPPPSPSAIDVSSTVAWWKRGVGTLHWPR